MVSTALCAVRKLAVCFSTGLWPGSSDSKKHLLVDSFLQLVRDRKMQCLDEMIKINTGSRALVYILFSATSYDPSKDYKADIEALKGFILVPQNDSPRGEPPGPLSEAYKALGKEKLKILLTAVVTFPRLPIEIPSSFFLNSGWLALSSWKNWWYDIPASPSAEDNLNQKQKDLLEEARNQADQIIKIIENHVPTAHD